MPATRVPNRLPPVARPRALIVALILVQVGAISLLAWGVAETYESVIRHSGLARFDQPMLDWMIAHRTVDRNQWITLFTTFGGPIITPIVAAAVMIVLALKWRSWTPVVMVLVAGAGSLAMTVIGKDYVARVRPPHELAVPPYEWSPSFPSGHALNSMALGGVIAYLICIHLTRTLGRVLVIIVALAYSLAMGASRIYLGHHWLTDVVTGWLLGLLWLLMVIAGHRIGHRIVHHGPAPADPESSAPPQGQLDEGRRGGGGIEVAPGEILDPGRGPGDRERA
ncbi:phosphoesterase [Enemella evansiae]|uniref:phosphatase PAP2 family protein n=1 Tax=Enemella evansiae TaxID=2016499 RepID=UPI000B95EE19|nr:phosphatase PAP2 family protein [Enemella evansiae]OYO10395.1 phosphoesterase [Enemella evansiae]